MGVSNRVRWEVQWHPASGARIRRLLVTSRAFRRLFLALGIAGWVVVAVGLLVGLGRVLTRLGFEAARRENMALRAQQQTLREQAFALSVRLFEGVERERRMARLAGAPGYSWANRCPRPPSRDAGNEALVAWLSEQGVLLEALGNELPAGRVSRGGIVASLPVPSRRETAPAVDGVVVQVAAAGVAVRREAAPARR